MVKTIAVIVAAMLVVSVAGVLLLAVSKPDKFRVQRTTSVKAPPDRIFPLIADFHGWSNWSPYEKLDPAMKRTFGGADKGKGAVYEWDSDGKAGKGRMEITDAPAPSKVTIKLDFFKPFESHNTAEFKLEPSGHHRADLGHVWSQPVHRQGHERLLRHGPDDREGLL